MNEENTNRGLFTLSGVTGMLIATVLLLAILAGLSTWGIYTQQDVMDKPYKLIDQNKIKEIGSNENNFIKIKE